MKQINERGLEALARELGATATVRFIRQFENGYGDYTKERETLLRDISIDDIVASIAERKQQKKVGMVVLVKSEEALGGKQDES
jgi:hypothetical protein